MTSRGKLKKQYIVVDIGCLECRDKSELLGVFDNLKDAEKVASKYSGGEFDYNWKVNGDGWDSGYKSSAGATVIFCTNEVTPPKQEVDKKG